jgi:hypothetical protein
MITPSALDRMARSQTLTVVLNENASLMVSYATIGKDLVEILEARKRGVTFDSIDLFDSDPII